MKKLMMNSCLFAMITVITVLLAVLPQTTQATVQRVKFQSNNHYLIVEFLKDNVVHFELSASGPGPNPNIPIFTTPMVLKTDYPGPSSFQQSGPGGNTLDTPALSVVVNTNSLCLTVTDKTKNLALTTLCPLNLTQSWKGLTFTPETMQHVYGLGEQFITPGSADGDWTGRVRSPGDNFGNQMVAFGNGFNGNAQIPILYAVGPNNANYALFLDQVQKQNWDFTGNPWKVETWGDPIRWYVMTGPNVPSLRQAYLELTGRPPVPPKKMFGLWVSEFGYDNWTEIDGRLNDLRTDKFPVDGFMLDLQWFGGVPSTGNQPSQMGRLTWSAHFPDAATQLARYKNRDGIGIITIEESYIDSSLPEHADLQNRGYLVRAGCATCAPVYLDYNPWWGKGGMIDWTLDAAADYWHDLKRQALINDGVIGHWTDLGEPEQYSSTGWANGVLPGLHTQADYHNLYNFKWLQSIARGYNRHQLARRPFMVSRSGAAGIQRFGAGMWSGDIGSNLANLATHQNVQMHMSMSGIDYFVSDIGGFHREGLNSDLKELYTQWFANEMMFGVPARPHTENLCNCKETAPDKIGGLASNLANARQRYELSPYTYSLAHRAYLAGEPVAPPLVYYYQNDMTVREMGSEKLLGRDLLVATVASPGATQRDIYLPAGDWINYHSNQWFHSTGQTYSAQPLYQDGVFRLPTYARAGAIIPKMFVDEKTLNILGQRTDGSLRNELIVRVYVSSNPSSFMLYEDDGETIRYQSGAVRTTALSQQLADSRATVTIAAANGNYSDAPVSRDNVIELVTKNAQALEVTLNGGSLAHYPTRAAFDAAGSGWFNAGNNLILAKSGNLSIAASKAFVFTLANDARPVSEEFVCNNGATWFGQAVYVVGNVPALGNWSPADAVKLDPTSYPIWTKTISNLPPSTAIEWKCIKRRETGDTDRADVWQPGVNSAFTSAASGAGGTTLGDFAGNLVSAQFICENGTTVPGQSVYVVGNIAALGNWSPASAIKLDPNGPYPTWSGILANLLPNATIEWKCIKRRDTGDITVVDLWQPGSNNVFTAAPAGFGGMTRGRF